MTPEEKKREAEDLKALEGAPEAPEASPKTMKVSLDTPTPEVVRLEKEGFSLFFEDEPGRFKELPSGVVGTLSSMNKSRYLVAKGAHARLKDQKEHPERFVTPGITVSPRLASATGRLEVRGKKPGMAYCWKRTDELQQASYDGWKVSADADLETFGGEVGSSHLVAAGGNTELVLMEIPEETEKQMLAAPAIQSKARAEGVEKATIEDMKRSGGLPYLPTPKDAARFS